MTAPGEQRTTAPVHATGAVEFISLDDVASDETFRLRPDGDLSDLATSLGRLGQLAPVELRPWPGAGTDGPRWQVVAGFRRLGAVRMLARERVLARLHRELSDEDAWGLALGEALLHEPLSGDDLAELRDRLLASGVAAWAEPLLDDALVRAPIPPALREQFYEWLSGAAQSPESAPEAQEDEGAAEPAPAAEAVTERDREAVAEGEPAPGSEAEADSVAEAEDEPEAGSEAGAEAGAEAEPLGEQPGGDGEEAPDEIEVTPEELVEDLTARFSELNQDLATAVEAWEDLPAEGRAQLLEQARYVAALLQFLEERG